jgi:spoIIIJ-associated protein
MTVQEYTEQFLELTRIEPDKIEILEEGDYIFVMITVQEEDAGKLIGNKGETLHALGQIISLSFQDQLDDKRIVVDVNDYKGKREERATEIGFEVAERVRQEQKPIDLPPMAAYERRVIHQALSEEVGVFTRSEGEGRNRRLVVYPDSYKIDA